MKSKSGFTIVELGISLAVVGILLTLAVTSYFAVQREGRNAKRDVNTTLIAEALEKYYDRNGEYPSCTMMQQSPSTISATVLVDTSTDIFKAPRAEGSITNSITCNDPSGTSDDVYAYLGDGSTQCGTGTSCLGWVIRYKKEGGDTAEIKSRHGSELAGHDAP